MFFIRTPNLELASHFYLQYFSTGVNQVNQHGKPTAPVLLNSEHLWLLTNLASLFAECTEFKWECLQNPGSSVLSTHPVLDASCLSDVRFCDAAQLNHSIRAFHEVCC